MLIFSCSSFGFQVFSHLEWVLFKKIGTSLISFFYIYLLQLHLLKVFSFTQLVFGIFINYKMAEVMCAHIWLSSFVTFIFITIFCASTILFLWLWNKYILTSGMAIPPVFIVCLFRIILVIQGLLILYEWWDSFCLFACFLVLLKCESMHVCVLWGDYMCGSFLLPCVLQET